MTPLPSGGDALGAASDALVTRGRQGGVFAAESRAGDRPAMRSWFGGASSTPSAAPEIESEGSDDEEDTPRREVPREERAQPAGLAVDDSSPAFMYRSATTGQTKSTTSPVGENGRCAHPPRRPHPTARACAHLKVRMRACAQRCAPSSCVQEFKLYAYEAGAISYEWLELWVEQRSWRWRSWRWRSW